jgi:hypothetical protein
LRVFVTDEQVRFAQVDGVSLRMGGIGDAGPTLAHLTGQTWAVFTDAQNEPAEFYAEMWVEVSASLPTSPVVTWDLPMACALNQSIQSGFIVSATNGPSVPRIPDHLGAEDLMFPYGGTDPTPPHIDGGQPQPATLPRLPHRDLPGRSDGIQSEAARTRDIQLSAAFPRVYWSSPSRRPATTESRRLHEVNRWSQPVTVPSAIIEPGLESAPNVA